MHVAVGDAVRGPPPPYDELLEVIERRLRARAALPPAARLRAARPGAPALGRRPAPQPPLPRARHRAALPRVRGAAEDLAGRVFSQQLDRDKPLWEVWLVEGLEDDRFAMLSKTHHALVDGVSGIDIMSVLFDSSPEPAAPAGPGERWLPRPLPEPRPAARRGAARARHDPGARWPARCAPSSAGRAASLEAAREAAVGVGAMAWAGLNPAPAQPLQRADRPAPPLHLGARRACATSRRSRTRSAAPSTTWCWPPSPARSGATCAAAGTTPTGSS